MAAGERGLGETTRLQVAGEPGDGLVQQRVAASGCRSEMGFGDTLEEVSPLVLGDRAALLEGQQHRFADRQSG